MWTAEELKLLRSLNTPEKIQEYLDKLIYNTANAALSPRYVMLSGDAHCLEGAMLAAVAMELQGHPPLLVDFIGHKDDDHVIYVYKKPSGWGSISKSNTTLLRGRPAVYQSIRELVMSYFPFYFTLDGQFSLHAYSNPINLNNYHQWNWRFSEENLEGMGRSFCDEVHYEIMGRRELVKSPKVGSELIEACFKGAVGLSS
jgi:hypothetical protein